MKITLMLFLFLVLSAVMALKVKSQERYVFECNDIQYPKIKQFPEQDTFFSDSLNFRLVLVNQIYTKKIDTNPGRFISSTEISKPDLYYSIQRLSKYYFKCLKKGIISHENVEREFASILDKCIHIYSEETNKVESELRAANNPKEIVGVFNKIVIKHP